MSEIKLSRDEMETCISFTAQERMDGIINVYTDDPVWIRKLSNNRGFEDVSVDQGINPPGKAFRSQNSTVTVSLRVKREYTDEEREKMRKRMLEVRNEQDSEA